MSITLVSPDRLEAVAFENPGTEIHRKVNRDGSEVRSLVVAELMYVAKVAA